MKTDTGTEKEMDMGIDTAADTEKWVDTDTDKNKYTQMVTVMGIKILTELEREMKKKMDTVILKIM